MAVNAREVRNYYYYSNGYYELQSVDPGNGEVVVNYQRNFLTPIPPEDLIPLVQQGHIDPAAPDWQDRLAEHLHNHQFFTAHILNNQGTDVGKIAQEYFKEYFTLENLGKASLRVVLLAASFYIPTGIARFCPVSLSSIFSLPPIGTPLGIKSATIYSLNAWRRVFAPIATGAVIKKISIGAATVITSDKLLSAILPYDSAYHRAKRRVLSCAESAIGIIDFNIWRSQVAVNAFSHLADRPVPHQFENDLILAQNQCPIAATPMRHPCRLPCNHLFELVLIRAWHDQCTENRVPPTCPLCRAPFVEADLIINSALSDRIELRILLLSSQQ